MYFFYNIFSVTTQAPQPPTTVKPRPPGKVNNKHLMADPTGNSEFVSPRPSMFPEVNVLSPNSNTDVVDLRHYYKMLEIIAIYIFNKSQIINVNLNHKCKSFVENSVRRFRAFVT